MNYLNPQKVDAEYPYFTDEFGEPAFVVGERAGTKQIRNTYEKDEDGDWVKGKPTMKLKPLFNLRATIKNRSLPVIIVNSEREVCFLTEQLGDKYIFVCCDGGFGGFNSTDLKPIADRNLFIITPTDHYGKIEACALSMALLKLNAFVYSELGFLSELGTTDIIKHWETIGPLFDRFISMSVEKPISITGRMRQDQAARAFIFSNIDHPTDRGILFLNGHWYRFNGNVYEPETKDSIFQHLKTYFDQIGQINICTTSFLQSVLTQVRAAVDKTEETTKFWTESNRNTLNPNKVLTLKDGLYRIRSNGKMQHVSKFTSKFFDTTYLPITYSDDAKSEKWEAFIEDILPNEDDRKLLQQWFGYHFCHTLQLRKYMTFYGSGANGKSVVCLVLRMLLGEKNCSSIDLDAFSKEFYLAETYRKIANISDELPIHLGNLNDGLIKKFMEGAPIYFNPKGTKGFTAKVTAKWTQATNRLATTKDNSNGTIDRTLIIKFGKRIEQSKRNPELAQERYWNPELPGILNWALQGTKEIIRKKEFTLGAVHYKHIEELKSDSTPEIDWLLVSYKPADHDIKQGASDVLNSYNDYLHSNGEKPIGGKRLKAAIEATFPKALYKSQPERYNRTLQRTWSGLSKINT